MNIKVKKVQTEEEIKRMMMEKMKLKKKKKL